jgi:hypothetical protein
MVYPLTTMEKRINVITTRFGGSEINMDAIAEFYNTHTLVTGIELAFDNVNIANDLLPGLDRTMSDSRSMSVFLDQGKFVRFRPPSADRRWRVWFCGHCGLPHSTRVMFHEVRGSTTKLYGSLTSDPQSNERNPSCRYCQRY